jgi:glucosamine-6-phosphate deaminase
MRTLIHENSDRLDKWTAYYIAAKIKAFNPGPLKPFVLGLPGGSSPVGIYRYLVELYRKGIISFKNVVTFNMDEYVGIPEDHPQSYHYYMNYHLFSHIDIPTENINILDGNVSDLEEECKLYEKKITGYGGIHLFIGAIGADGHIAFNEQGASLYSRTRKKILTNDTIVANSKFFGSEISKVPKTALTVGLGTIMDATEVLTVVSGYSKAIALQKCVEEGVNHLWNISMLQLHKNSIICCDEESTAYLRVGTVKYFKEIEVESLSNIPAII